MVALVLPSFLPAEFALTVILNKLGYGGITFTVIGIMMFIRIDGKPLLDVRALAKNFSWDVYILMAYFIPLSSLLTSDVTGVKPTLSEFFEPILSVLSPYAFVVTVIALAAILTNFLNNSIIGVLFASFVAVLGDSLVDVNVYALAVLIMFSSSFSMATPAANPVNAFLFSQTDLIKFKNHLIHGTICCLFLFIVSVTVLWAVANMAF